MAYDPSPVFFDLPPIAEVALSIQTAPIPGLQTSHMAVFWQESMRDDYPHAQDQPPVPPAIERFGEDAFLPNVVFGVGLPFGRQWYLNEDQTRLVQLQNDRLVVNWRRLGSTSYPHYSNLREEIERLWQGWSDFLNSQGLRQQPVVQAEVTYINQVPVEDPLDGLSDLNRLFRVVSLDWPTEIGAAESVQFEQRFVVDAPGGGLARMYLAVSPGLLANGGSCISFNLTVRGAPRDSSLLSALAWLDFAHNQITNTFADVTSAMMREKWRQSDGLSSDA